MYFTRVRCQGGSVHTKFEFSESKLLRNNGCLQAKITNANKPTKENSHSESVEHIHCETYCLLAAWNKFTTDRINST